jgi:hypothetical protein
MLNNWNDKIGRKLDGRLNSASSSFNNSSNKVVKACSDIDQKLNARYRIKFNKNNIKNLEYKI